MKTDQEIIQKIIGLASKGQTHREIAKEVFGRETAKSTVSKILSSVIEKPKKDQKRSSGLKIMFIPDCQVKAGVDLTYLSAIGQYIVDKKPDVVVNAGDFFDFPSLSSYDKGTLSFEGRRLKEDIEVGKYGMNLLLDPLREYQKKHPEYSPRMVFTLGNHDQRLLRISENNTEFDGFIDYSLLELEKDWEVHDFLKPVNISGIHFVHYLSNPMSGKPYGGTALNQLKTVGNSFCVGHKQTLDVAMRPTLDGKMQIGIIAGACYPFYEPYKGHTGNNHFRGIVMLHNAKDGFAEPSFISTEFLLNRYENNS